MKTIFLVVIIVTGLWAFQRNVPYQLQLSLYGVLAVIPVILLVIKKNMFYALLTWFFFVLFKYGLWEYRSGSIKFPGLPEIYTERLLWIALFIVFFFGVTMRQIKFTISITKIEIAMLLFCVYIVISMILAGTLYQEDGSLALRGLLATYVLPFSIFFLSKNIISDEQKIKKTFIFFSIIGFYLGITGIFEYYKLDYLVYPPYIMHGFYGIHFGRARGPQLTATGNGWAIAMMLFMTLHLLLHSNNRKTIFFYSISIVAMLITLLFTLSRAVWIGFLLGSLVIPLFLPQTRKVFYISIFALMIFISAFYVTGQLKPKDISTSEVRHSTDVTAIDKIYSRSMQESSVYGRVLLYSIVWNMFKEKPVFGFGFNSFRKHSEDYLERIEGIPYIITGHFNFHDALSGILAELGLVGLSFYLFIIINIFTASIRLYKKLSPQVFVGRGLAIIFWGIIILYSAIVQFSGFTNSTFQLSIFYLMAGIMVGLYQRISTTKNVMAN